jgi:hypothetical protein
MRPDDHPGWRRRLRAGERVRVLGAPKFWVLLGLLTLGSLYVVALLFARLVAPLSPLTRLLPSDTGGLIACGIFSLFWLGLSAYLWRGLFLSGVRFRGLSLEYDNWLGRTHKAEYARIVAVSWGSRYRTTSKWALRVCHRTGGGGLAWLDLETHYGWRTGLAEAVRDEIIARAGLRAVEKESPDQPVIDDSVWIADGYSRDALP